MTKRRHGARTLVLLIVLSFGVQASAAPGAGALLIAAVRAGDALAVAALLRNGADVNAVTPDGTTALHWAAHRDDVRLIDRLLRAGANVNATNRYGASALSLAALSANAAVMKRLLDAGADANATMNGETVLMTAAASGNGDVIRMLVARGANVDATSEGSGLTPLMIAAATNNVPAITALLDLGARVDARTSNPAVDNGVRGFGVGSTVDAVGEILRKKEAEQAKQPRQFTAFLFAARAGNIEAMQALLKRGANVNDTLANGMSALVLAVTSNKLDAASFLLGNGADPNAAGSGWTALHQLAVTRRPNVGHNQLGPVSRDRIDSLDFAKKLIGRGANVHARMTQPMSTLYTGRMTLNYPGNTPLMLAALRLDIDYMRFLVANGADPLSGNDDKTTPLMAAAGCGIYAPGENPGTPAEADEAIKWLLSLGADPNTVDAFGDTPLHCAAFRGAPTGIEALVTAGAKLDAKNMVAKKRRSGTTASVGWTPLMVAEGIFESGGHKEQRESAAVLRRLMQERGIPTQYELPGQRAADNASSKSSQ